MIGPVKRLEGACALLWKYYVEVECELMQWNLGGPSSLLSKVVRDGQGKVGELRLTRFYGGLIAVVCSSTDDGSLHAFETTNKRR